MKSRKLKLALTVELLNRASAETNLLQTAKQLMSAFRQEVGQFLGLQQTEDQSLNAFHRLNAYTIQFEHYTLDLEIVQNLTDNSQSIQRLHLQQPAAA